MGSQVAPSGYAWAFPHGDNRVRLGVGVIRPDVEADARAYLDSFTERLPALAPEFAGANPLEYHTGLFPSEGVAPRFTSDGLIATGDSAGHGSTLVGEGIRFAIYSGRMAGKVAAGAARAGDTSAEALGRYEREWRAVMAGRWRSPTSSTSASRRGPMRSGTGAGPASALDACAGGGVAAGRL